MNLSERNSTEIGLKKLLDTTLKKEFPYILSIFVESNRKNIAWESIQYEINIIVDKEHYTDENYEKIMKKTKEIAKYMVQDNIWIYINQPESIVTFETHINESQEMLRRRINHIKEVLPSILDAFIGVHTINMLGFERFLDIVSSMTARQVVEDTALKMDEDDFITLRNQLQHFIKNHYREEIKSVFLERIS